jgi:diguanylate cyclase (GGDEF)-like protein
MISNSYDENRENFQFENDAEGFWEVLNRSDFIKVRTDAGQLIYKSFWEKYNLQNLKSCFFRLFQKDNIQYFICSIGEKTDKKPFIAEEVQYLNKVLSYVEPILIKYIKRRDQENDLKKLQKSLHNISILYNISQAVNFIDDLKRLLRVILNKALDTIDAEKGSLMLYNFTENVLQTKVVYGLADKNLETEINNGLIECNKIKVGEGIAGTVFVEKKSIISNLGKNDPRFINMGDELNISSLLCVPLISKGEPIGVINITNKKNGKLFNKQDLEFIEALANQAAIAIDNAKLYELATKDGLTKLYIYRHFYTLLETELKRSARYNHEMTLLMMDIDNFKHINDTYGHPVGDQVLREIANCISQTVRKIDISSRYGGEEFTVILPETNLKDARIIAERLRKNISSINVHTKEGVAIAPTISIGMSEYPSCALDEQTLIELADVALYNAKNSGKNCVCEYSPSGCILLKSEE